MACGRTKGRSNDSQKLTMPLVQAIGGAPNALRIQRLVGFYEKLPRGPAPEIKGKGPLGRYQAKYFGKNSSVQRMFCSCCSASTRPMR